MSSPPLTLAAQTLAVLDSPPLTLAYSPLAALAKPPLTLASMPLTMLPSPATKPPARWRAVLVTAARSLSPSRCVVLPRIVPADDQVAGAGAIAVEGGAAHMHVGALEDDVGADHAVLGALVEAQVGRQPGACEVRVGGDGSDGLAQAVRGIGADRPPAAW